MSVKLCRMRPPAGAGCISAITTAYLRGCRAVLPVGDIMDGQVHDLWMDLTDATMLLDRCGESIFLSGMPCP